MEMVKEFQSSLSISWLRLGIPCSNANAMVGQPSDLTTTIGLAHLLKPSNTYLRTLSSITSNHCKSQFSCKQGGRWFLMSHLKNYQWKGLWYNCSEKFAPLHWCKKLFVIVACTVEEDGDKIMNLEQMEVYISLHCH